MGKYLFSTVVVVLAVTFQGVTALKCWRCSTDSSNHQYNNLCNDSFDESNITQNQRNSYLIECPPPPPRHNAPQNLPACKKTKQSVNGILVIKRSCESYSRDNLKDACSTDSHLSYIKTEFCELCDDRDGCNSAERFGPISLFIIVPILIAKLLTF